MPKASSIKRNRYFVMDRWFDLLKDEPPRMVNAPILYHYTDAFGVYGIISENCLWATATQFSNDLSEIDYAVSIAIELIDEVWGSKKNMTAWERLLAGHLAQLFATPLHTFGQSFIASFCENGDLLSQWRAYGGTSGFSLAFSPLVQDNEVHLSCKGGFRTMVKRVIYDPAKQRARLRFILKNLIKLVNGFSFAPNSSKGQSAHVELSLFLILEMTDWACAVKHKAFSEEKEWRVITYPTGATMVGTARSTYEGVAVRPTPRHWRVKFAPSLITAPPVKWDWATWFLSNPGSRSLYWKNLLLVLLAYPSQFLIVLFAISLIILLLRHNLFFLNAIFLRCRAGAGTDPDSYVVLDFNDGNERFGLSALSGQFNEQIALLSLAAGLTLISRWVNSDFQTLHLFVSKLTFTDISKPKDLIFKILDNSGHPFLTVGQIMFPTVWFFMFLVVMLPASAKWLPLGPANRINGGAKEFLRELLRPGDPDEAMATGDDVDHVAAKFARQPFWPVGDGRAEVLSVGAFFVFFVLLAPLLPVTFTYSLYYGALLVVSFLLSKILFAAFRYRLYNFDKRLVTSKK